MTTMLDWVLVGLGLPLLGASLYLLTLTLAWRRPTHVRGRQERLRFSILVPAHNEQGGIAATIASLQALDYPDQLRSIVVIADNCTDRTAALAASHGAQVIVRDDPTRRGKGWALQYAIDRLLHNDDSGPAWDALVVVDADTVVSPDLLRVFDAHFEGGASAVQAAYLPRKGGTGPMAVITDVAFVAFHLVRSAARERLGLSCGLRGNGMAFRRELLRDVSHAAFSRTEDLEFGILLGLRGVRVAFAGETRVYGEMPEQRDVVAVQRERWIGGRFAMARRFGGALVRGAVKRRSLMLADLACDLFVPPLSLLTLASGVGCVASLALAGASSTFVPAAVVWSAAFAGLCLHVTHAAWVAGQGWALAGAAGAIPRYALDRTMTALRALRPSEDTWVRTQREGEGQ